MFELSQRYQRCKADNQAARKFIEHLLSKLPEALSQHRPHAPAAGGDHPDRANNATLTVHGQAHHHRTVHIHSESDLKGGGFTQHQTRDMTVSLESGDSATPSQLQMQLQVLQDSFLAAEAEKNGLLERVRLFIVPIFRYFPI